MDTIGKRLQFFLDTQKIKTPDFLMKTGISKTTIYRLLNEESGINSTNIARIIEHYPTLNITWLITGNGTYNNEVSTNNGFNEEAEPYLTKNDAELKTKVRTILSNDVVLDVLVEILKRYDK